MCCSSEKKQRLEDDRWRYETSFNFSNATNKLDKRQKRFFFLLCQEKIELVCPPLLLFSQCLILSVQIDRS